MYAYIYIYRLLVESCLFCTNKQQFGSSWLDSMAQSNTYLNLDHTMWRFSTARLIVGFNMFQQFNNVSFSRCAGGGMWVSGSAGVLSWWFVFSQLVSTIFRTMIPT